jgi:hypothetical protein
VALIWRNSNNRIISKFLVGIATALGGDLLAARSPATPAAKLLKGQFGEITSRMQAEDALAAAQALAAEREAQTEEAETSEPLTAMGMLERFLTTTPHRKHRRPTAHALRQTPTVPQGEKTDERGCVIQKPPFFSGRARCETLHGLALGCETGGFLFGTDRPFRRKLSEFIKPCLQEMRVVSSANIDIFADILVPHLSRVNRFAQALLVKTKEDIETQTDVIPLIDMEQQTEPKDKGKSKKK